MRINRFLAVAAALAFGQLCGAAYAANTHVQSFTPGHSGATNSMSVSTSGAAVGANDNVMGFAKCWVNGTPPTVTSILDDKGKSYTIADTGTPPSGSYYRYVSFYRLGITESPTTITVTWSGNCQYQNAVADEFSGSLTALSAHGALTQHVVAAGTDAITSGNVTPTAAGSLAYGAAVSTGAIALTNPGTGWTAGITDQTAGDDYAYTEWRLNQGATSVAATFTNAATTQNTQTAIMVFSPPSLPTPTSASCSPSNPSLPDSSLINTVVCAYTVQMSDNSVFTGNVTVSEQGGGTLFGLSASTGNANLILGRAAAITDDGTQTALLNMVQNGVNVTLNVPVAITASPAAGTPTSFGWKSVNPGTTDTPQSGTVIFTAPRPMTVTAITGRVSQPIGASGNFVDVYKAASGIPCASGVKLHMGDFDANGAVDVNQPLQLAADTVVTGNTHTTTTIDGLSANVLARGWAVGDAISGSGIPANDTIATIAGNGLSLTLTNAATTTVSGDALTVPTPVAQGDNICVTTTGAQWTTNPAGSDATVTVTAQ